MPTVLWPIRCENSNPHHRHRTPDASTFSPFSQNEVMPFERPLRIQSSTGPAIVCYRYFSNRWSHSHPLRRCIFPKFVRCVGRPIGRHTICKWPAPISSVYFVFSNCVRWSAPWPGNRLALDKLTHRRLCCTFSAFEISLPDTLRAHTVLCWWTPPAFQRKCHFLFVRQSESFSMDL